MAAASSKSYLLPNKTFVKMLTALKSLLKRSPTLKSLVQRYRSLLRPKIPPICEDIMAWSPRRNYHIVKLHDAFTVKLNIPVNAFDHDIVYGRFLINSCLGFPAQFMSGLRNASVLGNGFVALEEGVYLTQGNWQALKVLGYLSMYPNRAKKSKQEYLPGNWYSIRSYWSHSYHHWFWDDLTRLLPAIPHLPADTQFLVGEPFLEFQRESLLALGITANRVKVQSLDTNLKIENLWFATPLRCLDYATTAPDVAKQLQTIFQTNSQPSPFRKIYISRSLAKYRRIVNEPDLIAMLESFGFEIIHAEKLSFESQVKLFNEAKVILSSHGAGLTNMLFAPSSALVIELFEPTAAHTHYWTMAHTLGHNYDCLIGETVESDTDWGKIGSGYPDFIMDVDSLQNLLNKYLNQNGDFN